MNNRKRFFNLLENKKIDRVPFFPDITTWYEYTRKKPGGKETFGPGVYIPDNICFHQRESRLNKQFAKMTFLDYYREFDWGLPIHIYDWYEVDYFGDVEKTVKETDKTKVIIYTTPKGIIQKTLKLAGDGSWAPVEYFVKRIEDLDIIKYVFDHRNITPDFEQIKKFFNETKDFGVCDLVIWRSPFGKLVHEFMGFENVVYSLYDNEKIILKFLKFLEKEDLKIIELAAKSPVKLVIISDHADENLISPNYYLKFCIPYYQKACSILHKKNKYISTHLDGNFRGYFPFIKETHFDLLDGCSPAPMSNYEPQDLSLATKDDLHCYCGVPSTLFTQHLPTNVILNYGKKIVKAFNKKVIVNIGDILPPNGDIKQVIELGKIINNIRI